MRKIIIGIIVFFLLPAFVSAIPAASCQLGAVQTAIANTPSGGTVNVPSGTCTWSSPLVIRKGISLIGAGMGNTVINSNTGGYLITYQPSPSELNELFRLSGFTIDCNTHGGAIFLYNPTVTPARNVRIDHNDIKKDSRGRLVAIEGTVYGVIDNNMMVADYYHLTSYGVNQAWQYLTFDFGTADNIYFEDNTFIGEDGTHASGFGGRYAARFNNYDLTLAMPWCDMHGNMLSGMGASTMGAEIYENTVEASGSVMAFDHWGGKGIFFNNNVITSGAVSSQIREVYHDSEIPPAINPISGQPQHISDSYYWNNRQNGNQLIPIYRGATIDYGGSEGVVPTANKHYWYQYDSSFDGSRGVGVGTYANRPSTCTAGVGYWATDQCEWNSLNPGNDGCLYKCISTNNWQLYYTPYTYPHPLRSGETPEPQCTTASDCADQNCRTKACTAGQCVYSNIAPICPSASNVNCGAQITSTNGCGYCSGTGTRCSTGTCTDGECVSDGTINAASCSYDGVSAAIDSANPGDTVNVPAGSCTWDNQLVITKGIYLIGDGIGNTVITSSYASSSNYLIVYHPSNYDLNSHFRISGFTFDLNGRCKGIRLGVNNKIAPYTTQTNIRIDHNRFMNPVSGSAQYIWHYTMYGVIDNNIFESAYYPLKADPNSDCSLWEYNTWTPGLAEDSMYIEDNLFNGVSGIVTDCQWSGRYVYRYNDIRATAGLWPMFDMHGNQANAYGMCACFGGEIYGNDVTGSYHMGLLDHRGGQAMVFYNNLNSNTPYIQVREEFADSGNPPTTAPDGQPQHVSDSYYWNNRRGATGSQVIVEEGGQVGDIPLQNRDYFVYTDNFDGTSGVGCGFLSSRPSTCAVGTGYWATDQSCTSLSGLVGKNPTTPISGTLYKCTIPNTWTAFYTPALYPHPLRDGGSPQCTTVSDCADQNCRTKACTAGQCVYSNIAPICPSASNVNCGVQIMPTNNCGSCTGTGTRCSTGTCVNGQCLTPQQECSDGTLYGQCSSTRPRYCDNGNLVDRCSVCGCASGQCQNDGSCKSQLEGDLDNDGDVDIFDLIIIAVNFGKSDFDPRADTNNDNVIDIFDLIYVARRFG